MSDIEQLKAEYEAAKAMLRETRYIRSITVENTADALIVAQAARIAELEAALTEISEYSPSEQFGYVDEWTEADSFTNCQLIASFVLANDDVSAATGDTVATIRPKGE